MKNSLYCFAAGALIALAASSPVRAEPVLAGSADEFVDRIGVATHWGYPDTPYGYAYPDVKRLLGESGIRHVRDGWHNRLIDLYETYGIRATVIFGPRQGEPATAIKAMEPWAALVDAVEGPNEPDIMGHSAQYKGMVFPAGPIAFQNDLYAAVKGNPKTAHLPVIAPSMARNGSNAKMAPLRSLDYLVMHSYAGGGIPTSSLDGSISNIVEATRILGKGATLKPIVVTESGYHTALGADMTLGGVQPGISERAHGKYLPRHYAAYYNYGIVRTIVYEFINEFKNEQGNAEASFGMVRRDLTPKPGYHSVKRLIEVLGEAKWDPAAKRWNRPDVAPGSLDLTFAGQTKDLHRTLLRKSNGDYYLLLWQEISVFDRKNKRDVENRDAAVTVTVGAPVRSAELYRLTGDAPAPVAATGSGAGPRTLKISVPDEIVILRLAMEPSGDNAAPAAPATLDAVTDGTTAKLTWPAVPGAAGYFVSRLGRVLAHTAAPAFADTNLIPDTGYPYEIRAHDAAGNVSAPLEKVVKTLALYPDLIVTDLTWTPAAPSAGEPVTFQVTIKNAGNGATAQGTTVGVAFRVNGKQAAWSDTLRTAIAPGESRTLTPNNGPAGPRWSAVAGEHTVEAHVDDVNRLNESDETNNVLTKPLTVR